MTIIYINGNYKPVWEASTTYVHSTFTKKNLTVISGDSCEVAILLLSELRLKELNPTCHWLDMMLSGSIKSQSPVFSSHTELVSPKWDRCMEEED